MKRGLSEESSSGNPCPKTSCPAFLLWRPWSSSRQDTMRLRLHPCSAESSKGCHLGTSVLFDTCRSGLLGAEGQSAGPLVRTPWLFRPPCPEGLSCCDSICGTEEDKEASAFFLTSTLRGRELFFYVAHCSLTSIRKNHPVHGLYWICKLLILFFNNHLYLPSTMRGGKRYAVSLQ